MVNRVILVGRLSAKPELKTTTSGIAVANITVVTSRRTKEEEKVEWNKVTLWQKNAENVCKFLDKGSLVYIEGRLETRNYEKDGQKHYVTEIQADSVQFLSPKKESSAPAAEDEAEKW